MQIHLEFEFPDDTALRDIIWPDNRPVPQESPELMQAVQRLARISEVTPTDTGLRIISHAERTSRLSTIWEAECCLQDFLRKSGRPSPQAA